MRRRYSKAIERKITKIKIQYINGGKYYEHNLFIILSFNYEPCDRTKSKIFGSLWKSLFCGTSELICCLLLLPQRCKIWQVPVKMLFIVFNLDMCKVAVNFLAC